MARGKGSRRRRFAKAVVKKGRKLVRNSVMRVGGRLARTLGKVAKEDKKIIKTALRNASRKYLGP